jgi:hypothetical protein
MERLAANRGISSSFQQTGAGLRPPRKNYRSKQELQRKLQNARIGGGRERYEGGGRDVHAAPMVPAPDEPKPRLVWLMTLKASARAYSVIFS